ncbi:hypothetical protein GLYMA_13G345802v4 [Glycine max]|nr:hypothetical protein GLYMA_13G345802v4 [Glycine max]
MFLSVRTNSQVFWLLCCSAFFQELRHEGVQSLLGLMHTTGTIPSALPPPISTLLASFNLPCNPNENGLTEGAHALAKHACRSGSGYWDSLNGNIVFEIRVAGGYGARWTEDGSKVWIPTKFWYLSASITGLCTVYCPILSHNLK